MRPVFLLCLTSYLYPTHTFWSSPSVQCAVSHLCYPLCCLANTFFELQLKGSSSGKSLDPAGLRGLPATPSPQHCHYFCVSLSLPPSSDSTLPDDLHLQTMGTKFSKCLVPAQNRPLDLLPPTHFELPLHWLPWALTYCL
jgi:hypothetical protein